MGIYCAFKMMTPSSRGLGHRPFTAVTGVRIPLGSPKQTAYMAVFLLGEPGFEP